MGYLHQVCCNLFDKTAFVYEKPVKWTGYNKEPVKCAGFVLLVVLSVRDKTAKNTTFEMFLPIIKSESCDQRNFVKTGELDIMENWQT